MSWRPFFPSFWEGFPLKLNLFKKGCLVFPMEIHRASESAVQEAFGSKLNISRGRRGSGWKHCRLHHRQSGGCKDRATRCDRCDRPSAPFLWCILIGCQDFNLLPTNGFSIKPLKVKLLAGEQKATEFLPFAFQEESSFGDFWPQSSTCRSGCGSKPMVPFWGRCASHFGLF